MFKRLLQFIPILLLSSQVAAQLDEELLPPEEAFAFDATVAGSDLIMTWTIADGYYMYRDKFVVASTTPPVSVGELIFPQGEMIDDPLFGDVEIFTKFVQIRAPIAARRAIESAQFDVVGQGCNKPIGICYPPIQYALDLSSSQLAGINIIPAAFASNDQSDDSLDTRSNAMSNNHFSVQAEDLNGQSIRVSIKAEDGYFVRRNSIVFNVDGNAIITAIEMPYGELVNSLNSEGTERYLSDFESLIQLTRSTPAPSMVKLSVQFEGTPADDANYTVIAQSFDLNLPELISEPATLPRASYIRESNIAAQSSWFWLIVSAFGAGLLLTFTPCVLPMIPILSSIIAGQGGATGKLRGGALAGVYVAGTVVSYGFIGGVAGATGDQLNAYFQNVWAIGILVTIFVLMALSMFGLYELRLPSALTTRLHDRWYCFCAWNFLCTHRQRLCFPTFDFRAECRDCSCRPGARRNDDDVHGAWNGGHSNSHWFWAWHYIAQSRSMDGSNQADFWSFAAWRGNLPRWIYSRSSGTDSVGRSIHNLRSLFRCHATFAGGRQRLALFVERYWNRHTALGCAGINRGILRQSQYSPTSS